MCRGCSLPLLESAGRVTLMVKWMTISAKGRKRYKRSQREHYGVGRGGEGRECRLLEEMTL